ncbi:hypothetical protein GE09DRAFT_1177544 [Coniochaeta sp. 2T2.1]|nr:hypothetical protein GE09DRAFT_1177544 [Coniochaeta sp. 2T2.1]
MDARSRRSSSSTMASFSTAYSSRDSFESRGMASSWGSQTSLESMASSPLKVVPAGRRTYADYQLQFQNQNQNWARNARPAPIKNTYKRKAIPGEIFAALPGEVLELILEELKRLHLQPGSDSCATCWMRDCCSIALSARKWSKLARTALYEDIQIVGEEAPHLKRRYKLNHGGRLVLLRRTLRSSPQIAAIVRSLKVPRATMLTPGVSTDEYHDLVASVVMACPNFERLAGFYPTYSHTFSRLFHALSTRQKLKEMNWIIEPSPFQRQHKLRPSINGTVPPGDLHPQQSQDFFDHHANWSHLTALTVHCRPGATLTPSVLLNDALNCLPVLHTLHLSNLPSTSFSDRNLACLPSSLKTLTLAHLPGVTTAGITAFATPKSSSSSSLTSLTLINTTIDSLPALCRILSSLPSLQTFNLVQPSPPILPADESVMLFPYLASPSLRKLHWDIPSTLTAQASTADTILARSVSAGGFPALRTLRAPNDPEGVFQSVCAPRERCDLPADRYRCATVAGPGWNPRTNSAMAQHPARTGSRGSSFSVATAPVGEIHAPFAPRGDIGWTPTKSNSDLHAARLAAQQRLEAARRAPRYFINVVDESGATVETHGVGAFIGSVESKVRYHLLPDVGGGSDESGGLVGVGEMLADNGEERAKERERSRSRDRNGEVDGRKVREGCTGKWNLVVCAACRQRASKSLTTTTRTATTPTITTSRPIARHPPLPSITRRYLSQTPSRPLSSRSDASSASAFPSTTQETNPPPSQDPTTPSVSGTPRPSPPSYYALFPLTLSLGPPPAGPFHIDVRQLRREFLRLQAASHPDFHAHASASAGDRRRAEATSALINGAFKTLSNPLLRAQYLLREQYGLDLAGDEAGSIASVEEDVLDEVLEAREVIEEAEEEGDLVKLREENEERIRREEEVIERGFREGDLEGLKKAVVRLRYWVNIRESVDGWERGKGVVLEH